MISALNARWMTHALTKRNLLSYGYIRIGRRLASRLQQRLACPRLYSSSSGEGSSSQSLQPRLGYEQGQEDDNGTRQYFYYIDHHGQLFLDDARMKNFTSCFKDKEFLTFFFTRLRRNNTDSYQSLFPWLSVCEGERNLVRCDDRPLVYTRLVSSTHDHVKGMHARRTWQSELRQLFGDDYETSAHVLECNHAGSGLSVPVRPEHFCMLPDTGRVYYPTFERYGRVGLVSSALALKLAGQFEFGRGEDQPPTAIHWQDRRYELSQLLLGMLDHNHDAEVD